MLLASVIAGAVFVGGLACVFAGIVVLAAFAANEPEDDT